MLAALTDYQLRFGPVATADQGKVTALLSDADSLVEQITGQQLEYVAGDQVTLDVKSLWQYQVFVPELPVKNISAVSDNGVSLDITSGNDVLWYRSGKIERRAGTFTYGPNKVGVTYDHGWQPSEVPGWLVALVCTMAHRGTLSTVTGQVKSEAFTDAYSVAYSLPAAGGSLIWVTDTEAAQLRTISAPMLA
jgi:hypothetical protein